MLGALVKDRDVTGFSWPEEQAAQRDHAVPYSLQDELVDRYSVADKLFGTYVVEADRLITGQNPARAVGEAVVRRLGKG